MEIFSTLKVSSPCLSFQDKGDRRVSCSRPVARDSPGQVPAPAPRAAPATQTASWGLQGDTRQPRLTHAEK